jgi:hypothetical protein
MSAIFTESYPRAFDASYIAFCQWLYTRAQDSVAGPLATHFLANGFLPNALDASGNFQPAVIVGGSLGSVGPGTARSWVSAAPGAAAQALRLFSFDALNISVRHYGPNCSLAQYNAALSAFQGS